MDQTRNKALGLLGLARKAGKLQMGEEAVGTLLFEKRARLTVLASDAGAATLRRIRQQTEGTRQGYVTLPWDKETLGSVLGRQTLAVAAFSDVSMALAFAKALPDGTVPGELLEDLEQRVARVKAKRKKN